MTEQGMCRTCRNSFEWHQENSSHHPYNSGETPVNNVFSKKKRPAQPGPSIPFDPVLRQVLMDKGIITAEDILAAQNKLMAIMTATVQGMGGSAWRTAERRNTGDDQDSSSPHPMT